VNLELSVTDQCYLSMNAIGLFCLIWSMRRRRMRQAISLMMDKSIAVISAIILGFFILISLLDSVHFANSESLLDKWLSPMSKQMESTYSPPLSWISKHQLESKRIFIKQQISQGILFSAVLTVLIFGLVLGVLRKFPKYSGWAALITLFLCLAFIIISYGLSRHLHVLGTGKIGEDVFYYSIKSIRTGLVIGSLTTIFMLPLALILGVSAGYFGGWVDDLIQYIYTTLSSIPGVLLITASVLSIQTYITNHPEHFPTLASHADARLLALCLILGITSWTSLCRLLRAETLKLREMDFVLAARVLNSGHLRILMKHLLPNVMHIVVITVVLDFSFLVLAEAVLSYVGVGVSPMTISWGNMINAARLELAREPVVWWPVLSAFGFMFTLVLTINLFADAVRDAFDPYHARVVI
jgi:peptide/nickel transport system permease protein